MIYYDAFSLFLGPLPGERFQAGNSPIQARMGGKIRRQVMDLPLPFPELFEEANHASRTDAGCKKHLYGLRVRFLLALTAVSHRAKGLSPFQTKTHNSLGIPGHGGQQKSHRSFLEQRLGRMTQKNMLQFMSQNPGELLRALGSIEQPLEQYDGAAGQGKGVYDPLIHDDDAQLVWILGDRGEQGLDHAVKNLGTCRVRATHFFRGEVFQNGISEMFLPRNGHIRGRYIGHGRNAPEIQGSRDHDHGQRRQEGHEDSTAAGGSTLKMLAIIRPDLLEFLEKKMAGEHQHLGNLSPQFQADLILPATILVLADLLIGPPADRSGFRRDLHPILKDEDDGPLPSGRLAIEVVSLQVFMAFVPQHWLLLSMVSVSMDEPEAWGMFSPRLDSPIRNSIRSSSEIEIGIQKPRQSLSRRG